MPNKCEYIDMPLLGEFLDWITEDRQETLHWHDHCEFSDFEFIDYDDEV